MQNVYLDKHELLLTSQKVEQLIPILPKKAGCDNAIILIFFFFIFLLSSGWSLQAYKKTPVVLLETAQHLLG